MNVTKSISMLSAAAAFAVALPAYAQSTAEPLRRAHPHNHTLARDVHARHVTVVRRPVVVQRPIVVQRPVTIARPVYVAPRVYSSPYRNYYGYYGNYYPSYWNHYRSYWNYYWSYWTYWNRSYWG